MVDVDHLPLPPQFVGRRDELAHLQSHWRAGARLIALQGPPGIGKSCLLRRLVETLDDASGLAATFVPGSDPELFLHHAYMALGGTLVGAKGWGRLHRLLSILDETTLLVLDGWEHVQHEDLMLTLLCRHPGRLIVTVEEPVLRVPCVSLSGLTAEASAQLVPLAPERWQGHPLTLRLAAGLGKAAQHLDLPGLIEQHRASLAPSHLPILQRACIMLGPVSLLADSDLEELVQRGLLEPFGHQRWTMHDLLRNRLLSDADIQEGHRLVAQDLDHHPGWNAIPLETVFTMEASVRHRIHSSQTEAAYLRYLYNVGGLGHLLNQRGEAMRAVRITALLLAAIARLPPDAERHRRLASLHFEHAVSLDQSGRPQQASPHYRQALRLHAALNCRAAYRFVLYNYIDNVIQRGYLPFAERLARLGRALIVRDGEPGREPQGWIYWWYVRCLRGRPTVDVSAVFKHTPLGPLAIMMTDILLRRRQAYQAAGLAEQNRHSGLSEYNEAAALLQATLAGLMDGSVSVLSRTVNIEHLQLRGWKYLLTQALIIGSRVIANQASAVLWLEKARELAHQHQYRLLEIDARLQRASLQEGVDQLARLAKHPHIDYLGPVHPKSPVRQSRVAHDGKTKWPCRLEIPEFGYSSVVLPHQVLVPWADGLPPWMVILDTPVGELVANPTAYRQALERSLAQHRWAPKDVGLLYELTALVAVAGYTPAAARLVSLLGQADIVEPLLITSLTVTIQPDPSHIDVLSKLIANRLDADPRLRGLACWQLGVLLAANGEPDAALDAYRMSRQLHGMPGLGAVPVTIERAPARPHCTIHLQPLVDSVERWRRLQTDSQYPPALDVLVPGWWSDIPICQGSGRPLLYRINQHRTRFLLGCRPHHTLYDSTLGYLKTSSARCFPMVTGYGLQSLVLDLFTSPTSPPSLRRQKVPQAKSP